MMERFANLFFKDDQFKPVRFIAVIGVPFIIFLLSSYRFTTVEITNLPDGDEVATVTFFDEDGEITQEFEAGIGSHFRLLHHSARHLEVRSGTGLSVATKDSLSFFGNSFKIGVSPQRDADVIVYDGFSCLIANESRSVVASYKCLQESRLQKYDPNSSTTPLPFNLLADGRTPYQNGLLQRFFNYDSGYVVDYLPLEGEPIEIMSPLAEASDAPVRIISNINNSEDTGFWLVYTKLRRAFYYSSHVAEPIEYPLNQPTDSSLYLVAGFNGQLAYYNGSQGTGSDAIIDKPTSDGVLTLLSPTGEFRELQFGRRFAPTRIKQFNNTTIGIYSNNQWSLVDSQTGETKDLPIDPRLMDDFIFVGDRVYIDQEDSIFTINEEDNYLSSIYSSPNHRAGSLSTYQGRIYFSGNVGFEQETQRIGFQLLDGPAMIPRLEDVVYEVGTSSNSQNVYLSGSTLFIQAGIEYVSVDRSTGQPEFDTAGLSAVKADFEKRLTNAGLNPADYDIQVQP